MSAKRKIIGVLLAAMAVLSGCGGMDQHTDSVENQKQDGRQEEITLWTFPVGNWGNLTSVSRLIASFQREHPEIHVKVECLTYDDEIGRASCRERV